MGKRTMRKNKYLEALSENLQTQADEKAGYPPNCNKGYVEKDGKCVPVKENTESFKHAKKNDDDKEKNGNDKKKKKNGNDKKKNGNDKEKNGDEKKNPFEKKK